MNVIDDMKRGVLVSIGTLALAACSGESTSDPKPSATATLLNHDKISEALDALSGAVSDLESAVGGFDSEDWKDVVPQVQSASESVSSALSNLKELMAGG